MLEKLDRIETTVEELVAIDMARQGSKRMEDCQPVATGEACVLVP